MHTACTDPRQCSHLVFLFLLDLTDYWLFYPTSFGLVSMLTYFGVSRADTNYIPMFSRTNLFLDVLSLNNKVILTLYYKHKT